MSATICCDSIPPDHNVHLLRLAVRRLWYNHDASVGDVVVQIPGFFVFEGGSVVHFDLKTRTINVELLSVGRNAQGKSRAARNFRLLRNAVGREVEGPELTSLVPVHSIRDDGVSPLLVRRDLQARQACGRRANWIEVDPLRTQVETREAEYTIV